MIDGKKTCILYSSWADLFMDLPDELAGQLVKAVLAYTFKGEDAKTGNPALDAAMTMMRNKLDEDSDKYRTKVERIAQARAEKKKQAENSMKSDSNQSEIKSVSDSVSVSVSDSVVPTVLNKRDRAFRPPSLEDVKAYCRERGNSVDAEKWLDYYTSNGWMVGRNKMKDWKAAVRTWEKREEPKRDTRSPGQKAFDFLAELEGGNPFDN